MDGLPFSDVRLIHRRGAIEILAAVDRSGRDVIIKRLVPERCRPDPLGVARFRREVAIHQTLHHPGVARCFGSGEGWLALELLQNGLDDPVRRPGFRQSSAVLTLLRDLAETLAYLHARGVIHADLKPAHIMFRGDRPVIIDFGIAALGSRDPIAGAEFAGSPRWMAAELIAGGLPSPASDVQALCAIGCWLLNGAPDCDEHAAAILERRLRSGNASEAEMTLPAGIDRQLARILEAGVGPQNLRPTAAQIVQLISRTTAG
ncbi:protein kinase domain-containing protein [Mesorhizobium sp. 1B3]|uniref:protein kinase domain-containing protein n=1 Tax=Mesorhizobium sp. 1B3 TaxID=3243599 RepID=UPI003D98E521